MWFILQNQKYLLTVCIFIVPWHAKVLLQMDNVIHSIDGNVSYLKLHCALLPGTQSSLAEPGESKIQNNNSKRRLSKKSNAATIFHLTCAFGLIFLIFLSLWKKKLQTNQEMNKMYRFCMVTRCYCLPLSHPKIIRWKQHTRTHARARTRTHTRTHTIKHKHINTQTLKHTSTKEYLFVYVIGLLAV